MQLVTASAPSVFFLFIGYGFCDDDCLPGASSFARSPLECSAQNVFPISQVSTYGATDSIQKALAGLKRINLEGLRWRVFDAKGQVLGRLASQISLVLQGKDKPTYTPHQDDGDMCVVLNSKDICVTGKKLTNKFYRWHTGYVGHLKERSLKDQMVKDSTEVIRKAVLRMLPKNKLRDDRDRKLRIFADSEHPFADRPLEPFVMAPRKVREMRPRERRAIIRAQKKAEQSAAIKKAVKSEPS